MHLPKGRLLLSNARCAAGVLQVEAMAQLGGIVMMDPEDQAAKKNFFFGGIDGCKFRRPVVPGDTLVSVLTFVGPVTPALADFTRF